MKRIIAVLLLLLMFATLFTGCRKADFVAYNVSKEADNFNVQRKLTVLNARTDSVVMEMIGTFSIVNNTTGELEIICQVAPGEYKKHFVYLNNYTLYTVEDISGADVEPYHYELDFYPQMIPLTDIDIKID